MNLRYWVEVDTEGKITGNRWWSMIGVTPLNKQDNWVEVLENETFDTRRWNGTEWEDVLISLEEMRRTRDNLLRDSDYTQLLDSPLRGNPVWLTYRQQLRDMTVGYIPTTIPNYPTDPANRAEKEEARALALALNKSKE